MLRRHSFIGNLGRAKLAEEPNNALAWFELGALELIQFNNQPVALTCLQNAVSLEPTLVEAWILLFHLHDARQEYDLALAVYHRLEALNATPSFQIRQRAGDFLHDRQLLKEACACYHQALDPHQTSLANVSPVSLRVVESKLGYTEVRLGQLTRNHQGLESGLAKLQRAAIEAPNIPDNHARLIKALLLTGDLPVSASQITPSCLPSDPASSLKPARSQSAPAPATPAAARESA